MADTIYCYTDTNVLINKLGIRDQKKLHTFERKFTMIRLLELIDKPIQGNFDLKHLQAIHRYIFQDVYEWAGEIRKIDIAKGNNIFFRKSMPFIPFGRVIGGASASLSVCSPERTDMSYRLQIFMRMIC